MQILHRGEDSLGRRLNLSLSYEGQDISVDVSDSLISCNYRDSINEFDTLEITLHDREGNWIKEWAPQKGDKLEVEYTLIGWGATIDTNKVGTFFIDSINYSGTPDIVSLKAISVNLESNIMDGKENKSWEQVTLKKIAEDITTKCGIELMYEVDFDRTFERVQQSNESDMTLLKRLCQDSGINIKLYSDRLILFEESVFEAKQSITSFDKWLDCTNYSFSIDDQDTYDSCEISFMDYYEDKVVRASFSAPARDEYKNKTNRVLFINEDKSPPGESVEQKKEHVMKIAQKMLRDKNKNGTTGRLEIIGQSIPISAGDVIEVNGFGRFDGNYLITEVVTDFDMYKHSLGIRKCLEGY